MEPLNWSHILTEAAIILVPMVVINIGALYLAFRQMHWTLFQFPPHRHSEKTGMLYADGVTYVREEIR